MPMSYDFISYDFINFLFFPFWTQERNMRKKKGHKFHVIGFEKQNNSPNKKKIFWPKYSTFIKNYPKKNEESVHKNIAHNLTIKPLDGFDFGMNILFFHLITPLDS